MDLTNKKRELRKNIAQHEGITLTISNLKVLLNEDGRKNKILLIIESQFKEVRNREQIGVIGRDQYNLEINVIRRKLLNLVDSVDVSDIKIEKDNNTLIKNVHSENNRKVFLCHSKEDIKEVEEVYWLLKGANLNPWLSKYDILPGISWKKEAIKAIENSAIIITFLSDNYKFIEDEREFKLLFDLIESDIMDFMIIPIRLNECEMPSFLSELHYIDLNEGSGIDLLMKAVKKELGIHNTFIDPRDGQIYETVELIGKTWLAENLRYKTKRNCWSYENDLKNVAKHGLLYSWEAAQQACPSGWHIPTDEEWKELANYYGGYNDMTDWSHEAEDHITYNALIKNGVSGFEGTLSGRRDDKGRFGELERLGYLWCDAKSKDDFQIFYYLLPEREDKKNKDKKYPATFVRDHCRPNRWISALSLRCIKDE